MNNDATTGPITALIFDLDGTLIDSAPDLHHAVNQILSADGRSELSLEDITAMIGQGTQELIRRALAAGGDEPTPDEVDFYLDKFLVYYSAHLVDRTTIYPGVISALQSLAADGTPMAICTNKPSTFTTPILHKLGLDAFFKVVSCGDMVPHKKPDGRHVLVCIEQLGAAPGTTILIGDSENDINAAIDAGIRSVCVTFGYAHVPMDEIGADLLIDHFDDLAQALADISKISAAS